MIKLRFFCLLALTGLAATGLAGCGRTRAPSPAELRQIALEREKRTATGTVTTKLEARPQPLVPRAGEFSFWDLKVFKMQDKPDGSREEWKFFSPLPQPSNQANTTDVLMQAWLISRDGEVFSALRPSYKAYGSFNTDWTPPRPGLYTLFVQYRPAERGQTFETEMARWDFTVAPGKSAAKPLGKTASWTPSQNPAPITLNGASDGEPAGTLSIENLPTRAKEEAVVKLENVPEGAQNIELVALSAGGNLLHFPALPDGRSFTVSFPQPAIYRVWAYFSLNDAPHAAPLNHAVS
ncbi:MAG TPA: hypothetical protein VF627_01095 [Abditibacterium sp.]|jgi:hypothetical protein